MNDETKTSLINWSELDDKDNAAVAANLRAMRERCGLTQNELAIASAVTISTIKGWERGDFPASDRALAAVDDAARRLALAETMARQTKLPKDKHVSGVRLPIFRNAGELMWWATLIKDPLRDLAALFAIPALLGIGCSDLEADAEERECAPGLSPDALYGMLCREPSARHADILAAERIAAATSISRANAIFSRVAKTFDSMGTPYTFYYPTDLANCANDFAPFLEERPLTLGFGSAFEAPAECSAKSPESYYQIKRERLSNGINWGGALVRLSVKDWGMSISPLPGHERAMLPLLYADDSINDLDAAWMLAMTCKLEIAPGVTCPEHAHRIFEDFDLLSLADLRNLDTSRTLDMSEMFSGSRRLGVALATGWDVSSATSASSMFSDCEHLSVLDISEWTEARNICAAEMFDGCRPLNMLRAVGTFKEEELDEGIRRAYWRPGDPQPALFFAIY